MCLLFVNLYEFGQFLQILLWIFLPMAVIAVLITTYLHYRKKRAASLAAATPAEEEERADESWPEDSNQPYQGYLWMKDKYEEYRQRSDERYYLLKEELAGETGRVKELHSIIDELNNTITDLSARLEANRRLLLNIHNELNASLKEEGHPVTAPLAVAPAEPISESPVGPVEHRIIGWVESSTDPVVQG